MLSDENAPTAAFQSVSEESVVILQPFAQCWPTGFMFCFSMSADSMCHVTVGILQIMFHNHMASELTLVQHPECRTCFSLHIKICSGDLISSCHSASFLQSST